MFKGKGKCRIKLRTEAREGNERASVGGYKEKIWKEEMEVKSEC